LYPKKPKYLKSFSHKNVSSIHVKNNNIFRFSCVALLAKKHCFIPNFQIEAVRLLLRKFLKKRSQLFFRVFPNVPITKKPNEIRLGRGKGNLKH
jgi:large subunit ribosomal protein L16